MHASTYLACHLELYLRVFLSDHGPLFMWVLYCVYPVHWLAHAWLKITDADHQYVFNFMPLVKSFIYNILECKAI